MTSPFGRRPASQLVIICLLWLFQPNSAQAQAHALIGRSDTPMPGWLFAWAAAIVMIVSFFAMAVSWRQPRFEACGWRPLRFPALHPLALSTRLIGVALLALTVYAGFAGTEIADRNFAVPFVFVTFWLGMVALSVLFGDLFRALNPWLALADACNWICRALFGIKLRAPFTYPERLGRLPALIGLVGFGWMELVYGPTSTSAVIAPSSVALAITIYSVFTWIAIGLFGRQAWLDHGESFSVYYHMFSRLSIFERRDGKLGRRPFLSGLPGWSDRPGSTLLVLTVIGITTFDGAAEGVLATGITGLSGRLDSLSLSPVAADRISLTVFFTLSLFFVYGLFWLGIRGMRTSAGGLSTRRLGHLFGHTFVPIALAYLVAHYFSFFIFQMQAQFTFLISDPLGRGWDLFGNASAGIDYDILGASFIWYVQLATLLIGHITALMLAHDRALGVYKDIIIATRSQYWMLALMVCFTCLGLFLLSYSNQ